MTVMFLFWLYISAFQSNLKKEDDELKAKSVLVTDFTLEIDNLPE